ncbi:NAD-dependent epimerase/dehydratase family protein [bacterium]|nr:NAD-dependent epimerase/dehydratase family protein [bacterium]
MLSGKQLSENLCKLYSDTFSVPTVVFRYFNVFGPGQSDESEYSGVIAKFINKIKNEESVTIFGDGHQTRDFVYVDNVVNANVNASLRIENVCGKVINLGTGVSVSIKELAEKLFGIFDKNVDINYEEARGGEIKDSKADVACFIECFLNEGIIGCEEGGSLWIG